MEQQNPKYQQVAAEPGEQPIINPDPLEERDLDEESHRQLKQNEQTGEKIFSPDPARVVEEERDLDEEAHRQLSQKDTDIPGQ